MPATERIIDFDDRATKVQFLSRAGGLTGRIRVTMERHKPKRSLRANARYWAAVVPAFQSYMRSHGQYFEPEEIHEFFLQKFASRNVIDPRTGEVLAVIGRRSSKMDAGQFAAWVHDVEGWMLDRHGVVVPDPEMFAPAPQRKVAS